MEIQTNDIRPEIIEIALAMETKLRGNESKGGWGKCSLQYLSMRITQEKNELISAVQNYDSPKVVLFESADVCNFAMMIYDNYRKGKYNKHLYEK